MVTTQPLFPIPLRSGLAAAGGQNVFEGDPPVGSAGGTSISRQGSESEARSLDQTMNIHLYAVLAVLYLFLGTSTVYGVWPLVLHSFSTAAVVTGDPALLVILAACVGAGFWRAASLAWFIRGGADRDELRTWRYQRANIALGLYGLWVLLVQPLSWSSANVLVLVALALAGGFTVTVCLRAFLQSSRQGMMSASALRLYDLNSDMKALGLYLFRDLSTLAGWVYLMLAVVGCCGAWHALGSSSGTTGVCSGHPTVMYLERLVGASLWLLAAMAHQLLEYADRVRAVDVTMAIKLQVVHELERRSQLPHIRLAHVEGSRFMALHWGMASSLGIQAWFLWQGSHLQVSIPGDNLLWASLYWSVLLGAVMALLLLRGLDMNSLRGLVVTLYGWMVRGVHQIVGTLFINWNWVRDFRR